MRACEGCRRRKIKCDAATTNTWPCSACIRLKLHCVRPNGYDGSEVYETAPASEPTYESTPVQEVFRQHATMPNQQMLAAVPAQKPAPATSSAMYAPQTQTSFADATALYHQVPYSDPAANLHYTTVPPQVGLVDSAYAAQPMFPSPPQGQLSQPDSPPDSYSQDSYSGDLADLLGSLRMNEAGTGIHSIPRVSVDSPPDVGFSPLPEQEDTGGHRDRRPLNRRRR